MTRRLQRAVRGEPSGREILTTLVTALILFQLGTGPVRGFAITLSIGIVASFFSAVIITRTLVMLYLARRRAVEPVRK